MLRWGYFWIYDRKRARWPQLLDVVYVQDFAIMIILAEVKVGGYLGTQLGLNSSLAS